MIPTINVNWNGKNCVEKWKLYMSFDIWLRRETKLATRICALEIQLNEHTYNYAPPLPQMILKRGEESIIYILNYITYLFMVSLLP